MGLSIRQHQCVLDIADVRGAGSGEGILTRFVSQDGATLVQEKPCYYLVHERCYRNVLDLTVHPELKGALPPRMDEPVLKINACPTYLGELLKFSTP